MKTVCEKSDRFDYLGIVHRSEVIKYEKQEMDETRIKLIGVSQDPKRPFRGYSYYRKRRGPEYARNAIAYQFVEKYYYS